MDAKTKKTCRNCEALRERAEEAEARIASVTGVTREELAKREHERGLRHGEKVRKTLLMHLKEALLNLEEHFGPPSAQNEDEAAVLDGIRYAIALGEGKS